jgi:hypothetical protein
VEKTEARDILEDIARNGPPSAQVSAIRVLLRLEREEEAEQPQPSPFDELYDGDEVSARRKRIGAASRRQKRQTETTSA